MAWDWRKPLGAVEPPEWNDHCSHGDYYGPAPAPADPPPEKLTAVLVGAAAAATQLRRPVRRRSLLFPWRSN